MSARVFGVAAYPSVTLVYDPASGHVRTPGRHLAPGLVLLEPAEVAAWPLVEPNTLGLDTPVSMCWSPLVRCNLACPQCLDDKSLKELGPARRAEIGQQIAASGILGVDISGGEPLLLPDLPDLAAQLAAGGRAVSVTTNGWHLARRAHELAWRVHAVRVSFDGADPDSHDRLRGADSFRRAVEGVRAAVAIELPLQIQTVVMASTLDQCQPMIDLAAGLRVNGVTFLQMLPIGEGAAMAEQEMVSDEAVEAHIAALHVPDGLEVRLRRRTSAGGFTVVRADGQIWRNGLRALDIAPVRRLAGPADLATTPTAGGAT